MISEISSMVDNFTSSLDTLKTQLLLSGEYDNQNVILKLNAGAGGTESCDWCSMLYRMYTRWANSKGYSVEVLDYLDGEEAGIKSVTIQINGENAYGYLKSEHGVHRLVRISPFNAAGKRQTSFVSCDIMPDIDEDLEVDINALNTKASELWISGVQKNLELDLFLVQECNANIDILGNIKRLKSICKEFERKLRCCRNYKSSMSVLEKQSKLLSLFEATQR